MNSGILILTIVLKIAQATELATLDGAFATLDIGAKIAQTRPARELAATMIKLAMNKYVSMRARQVTIIRVLS
jgi:hypothetical protein